MASLMKSVHPTVTNHPSLYLHDGNVVLVAPLFPSSTEHIAFRVHQSLLSKISPVFSTMFSLPSGDDKMEEYDGAPRVDMPDPAGKLEALLQVVYHEVDLPSANMDPHVECAVKDVLTLSTKYAMDHFRRRIVEVVERVWPMTLGQWDRRERIIKDYSKNPLFIDGAPFQEDILPEPASAIRLARDCVIPSILPAAFYHLSRLSILDDYGAARPVISELEPTTTTFQAARWGVLHTEDLICLIKGRTQLSLAAVLVPPIPPCADCSMSDQAALVRKLEISCRHAVDILATTRCYVEKEPRSLNVCYLCASHFRSALITFREELWQRLPDMFALG